MSVQNRFNRIMSEYGKLGFLGRESVLPHLIGRLEMAIEINLRGQGKSAKYALEQIEKTIESVKKSSEKS